MALSIGSSNFANGTSNGSWLDSVSIAAKKGRCDAASASTCRWRTVD